jgi:sec-independent protein translocase protein TatB
MFGIEGWELIIIVIIALVVLGPERLPEVARQAGSMVRTVRQMYANVRADMGPEFDDFERGVRDLRSLNPREQVRNYSRNLIDNVQAEVPEIKQIANPPKLNVDQAARNLLRDEVLDTPIGERASQPSSNGHTPPTTGTPAADGTDHYE